ncbi:type II toxin-antitoxin system VapC family toxin [Noviherbaspirillum pedocola]|uniref:Type II toxin-antitoxin system VapC family toxin n=1 Tax=Noviherbaspirillum pedocola TaxID=2801341 RepID=A0A934SQJ3_9BURK|nr:type II toxin-antitoxin system VapC family toxin [Noviherbaspirillum pedocola]MBK4734911.1 type II toxin-antitoxin system VapC family toxin [Noviherbaspirillum pedocola]
MKTYLLDTNIASHIIKGDIPSVRERLVAVPMHAIAISVVTEGELLYGLAKRGYPQGLSMKVRAFLSRVNVLPWTSEVAMVYADLRASCESAGMPLAPLDMMIAAHVKSHALRAAQSGDDVVLVTRDRAFARIPGGLGLEDWTS